MNRNFSAKSTSFKQQTRPVSNFGTSDSEKTLNLKSRLFERGISAKPLPSVAKPKVSQSSKKLQTVPMLNHLPESRLLIRPDSSRTNSAYTSTGALRPTSAMKIAKIPASISTRTITQPYRPETARTTTSIMQRINTSRTHLDVSETTRTANLIEKLTNRPKTAKKEIAEVPEFNEVTFENYLEFIDEETELDEFIRLIKERKIEEKEFIYLLRASVRDNCDYVVVPAEIARNESNYEFYTLSAKGLSMFVNGSPVEFISLHDWLIERKHYFELKNVAFFKKFRVWKTVKMWLGRMNRVRRERRRKKLEDKLYSVDPTYSKILLSHRQACLDLEKVKFIDIPGHLDQNTLEEFIKRQEERIEEVQKYLKKSNKSIRESISQGVVSIMNQLREDIVIDIATEKNYGKINLQMLPHARKICTLYEKMGFPENMSYSHRSVLRKECTKYIRFTYLADFITLESLQNLYLFSVRELLLKIYEQISEDFGGKDSLSDKSIVVQAEAKKRTRLPLFKINLKLDPDVEKVIEKIPLATEFAPRKSPADEFHPNIHLNFDGEYLVSPAEVPLGLEYIWLDFYPLQEDFASALENLVFDGLDCLRLIERLSRHPELNDFVSALEEWDDKVTEKWIIPEVLELDVVAWLEDQPLYRDIHRKIRGLIRKGFKICSNQLEKFAYSVSALWKNYEIDFALLEKPNLLQKIDSFDWVFSMFKLQRTKLEKAPRSIDSGLFRIDCTEVRNSIINYSRESLKKSHGILLNLIRTQIESCKAWASKSVRALGIKVFTVEDFVAQKIALAEVNDKISDVKRNIDLLGQLYNLGVRSEIGINTEDMDIFQTTSSLMTTLNGYIINIESTSMKNTQFYKKQLKLMVPDFLQDVSAMTAKISEERYLRLENDQKEIIRDLQSLLKKSENFEEISKKIVLFQEVLEEPLCAFTEVQDFFESVDIRHKLWKGLQSYEKVYKQLMYSPLKDLDPQRALLQCEEYLKIIRRCESSLPVSGVSEKLKTIVGEILGIMPVIIALRAPLQESHWKQLREVLGEGFQVIDSLTLSSLTKYSIIDHSETIQAIGIQASQESELKQQLQSIVLTWEEMEIPLQQYKEKDLWILGDIEILIVTLEESLARINIISGNRYVAPLRDEVNTWKSHLNLIQITLEEWTAIQKTWIYFHSIFASQDIKRRLANETQIFESVDKFYRALMKKVSLNNNALKVMVHDGKLLENLRKFNNSLDAVQRNLTQYLEDKRMVFPRFYFISDDELLKVLANSANPLLLQPYISKCFENIYRLEFSEDLKSGDILAMVSREGEVVSFDGRLLKTRGNVEDWLGNVQGIMVDTLARLIKYCKEDAEKAVFKNWVLGLYPGQVIATVSQINWCIETDLVLSSIDENPNILTEWVQNSNKALTSLVELVRTQLSDLKRKLVVSMITTSVHNRDVLTLLQDFEVETNSDFIWQQQLRYYWDNDLCIIKQINFSTTYAYEYLGCTSRLVITPLTEKCWITITSALNIKLGACPSGPAGTGKTESTKDLAKALGQLCIVFNCSDQITYKMISRLLAGLVQQGAWSCLDEFNRIDIEVLSVVAQQLQTIKQAQVSGVKEFMFEGRKILVKSTFGVFITMNPGYAGRTELPDNLKVLFRPVAMMIPDYAMISEIMLLSEGFQEGTRLSKKIVQLYKLASEQLSTQFHYDFGLRALKAVLLSAGAIRRKSELTEENNLDEDVILIQAMNESNLPKLVAADVTLFKALVADLFPKVPSQIPDNSEFIDGIRKIQKDLSLQSKELIDKKVLDLYGTLQGRFGTMLVGPAMSGKSTILKLLALHLKKITHIVNPKAISIGELYGDMNLLTQDWKDGLGSSILREITNCKEPERHWVVFDGPVDPLWIENMNTVLDDNMMLCLSNGERIKLKENMRILFEVSELSTASPATISRCGMVYVPQELLTWNMIASSWTQKIQEKDVKNCLNTMFTTIVPQVLNGYIEGYDMVNASATQKVQKLCGFLTVLMGQDKVKAKNIPQVFAFAVIWTLGALIDSSKYEKVFFYVVF